MSPLSPLAQQSRGKSNVRLAVISIIALHAVFFGGLLLQGCKPKTTDQGLAGGPGSTLPTNDLPPLNQTNLPPFGPDTTQPGLAGQPFGQAGQPLTPGVPTNTTWAPPTFPSTDPSPLPPAAVTTEYVVRSGDVPARIAKDHGVSLSALMQANPGLEPRRLKVGQRLQIPAPTAAGETAAPGVEPSGERTLSYVVKAGDNLTKIAKNYGVTIKELRTANNLKTDRINVGQKLKVPSGTSAPAEPGAGSTGTQPPAGGTSGLSQ